MRAVLRALGVACFAAAGLSGGAVASDARRGIVLEVPIADVLAPREAAPGTASCDGSAGERCYDVATTLTITVKVEYHDDEKTCTRRCRLPVAQRYVLTADGYYAADPIIALICPTGAGEFYTAPGTYRTSRRGKVLLDPASLGGGALPACVGDHDVRWRAFLKPSADGLTVTGKVRMGGRQEIGDADVIAAFVMKHKGVVAGGGELPPLGRKLKDCPPLVTVSCYLDA